MILRPLISKSNILFFAVFLWGAFSGLAALLFSQEAGDHVNNLVTEYCQKCHGKVEPKGDVSLLDLSLDPISEEKLGLWETVIEQLKSGEMPPQEEKQPDSAKLAKTIQRMEAELDKALIRFSEKEKSHPKAGMESGPTSRRLTNDEYQNTMRDLLGIDLKLKDRLPKDPFVPYRFHNTAEFMRMGPEQINRYLECARFALESAIVDPELPEIHKTRREWKASGNDRGLGGDEIGVYGNRRHTPAWGMGLKTFPKKGEFCVKVKASAILPKGVKEVPVRLIMGYSININSSTQLVEPVGDFRLTRNPDHPEEFEFRGRMENYPAKPGKLVRGKRQPDSMVITPQNLYDDGTLNDDRNFGNTRNISLPRAAIHSIEFEAPVFDSWPPEHHKRILFDSPLKKSNPDLYVQEVLKKFIDRAYRRPATKAEVDRFFGIYRLVAPELDSLEASVRETLAMVLISPQFLYHTQGPAAEHDAGELSSELLQQYAIASRLSYFLWSSMPDAKLVDLAKQKKLADPKVLGEQIDRMLADDRSQAFLRNFTSQWLSLEKMKTVPINRNLFPRFLYYVPRGERAGTEEPYRPTIRDYMVKETIGFIAELIGENESLFNIVDSDFAYLNQPLAAHYGINGVEGNHFRRVSLDQYRHLGGLLTQGSILIGNGTGTAPHPIYRAVWLREAILGDEVPPPPAEVPALSDSAGESAEKALSIKDLLVKHRQVESCNDCHARLDPWGIPFEQFNAVGQFQPRVPNEGVRVAGFSTPKHQNMDGYRKYLDRISTVDVAADSKLPDGQTVDGLDELKDYLLTHRKQDIAENVLGRLLSYSIGRDLELGDRLEFKKLLSQAETADYRCKDMIKLVCQSSLFLQNLEFAKSDAPVNTKTKATSKTENR